MKKTIKYFISLALILCLSCAIIPVASSAQLSAALTDMSDTSLSSIQFVQQKLKVGFNIGNQFDGCIRSESYTRRTTFADDADYANYWETLWTNPQVTQTYISALKSYGIQLIRLPVTWYDHLDEDGVINPAWLNRVQEVVNMIIESGMYCIINAHHDGCISYSGKKIILDAEHRESTSAYLRNIWTQVGTRFRDYGTKLLFEGFNEPGDSSKSMSPSTERQAESALQINVFIKTIRDLGGNNAERFLVCPGYAGLSFPAYALLEDTAESKLIATTHSYYSNSTMDSYYASQNINNSQMGYIIDEIGSSGRRPDADNGALAASIRSTVNGVTGLSTCWWDNGMAGEYCLVNRYDGEPVNYKTLSAYVGKTITPTPYATSTFEKPLTPYYAKFYTEDAKPSGKKYFAIASQYPITSVSFYSTTNPQCYYSFKCENDGFVTVYESDDNVTFNKLDTRYINAFSYAKWKFCPVLGSTEMTYWMEGNYEIPGVVTQIIKHSVKIDGVEQAIMKEGKSYILPDNTDAGFFAYSYNGNFYKPGDAVLVDRDIDLITRKVDLSMCYGAAMRLNEQTGIRFYTNVNPDQISSLRALGATVSMGTIIAHSRRLRGREVNLELPETSDGLKLWVDVTYNANTFYTETLKSGNFSGIVGSLVAIKDTNSNVRFVGRGYVSVSAAGITKTYYASYAEEDASNNSRCISFIAKSLRDNTEDYNAMAQYKSIIDKYADLYDDPIDPTDEDKF